MGMMDKMMEFMMGRTSQDEKEIMMAKMMEKFFGDMTAEDKQKMMGAMMSRMMGSGQASAATSMPSMMVEMIPQCLRMMLPGMPAKKRVDFILSTVNILMEQGSAGMSGEEKQDLVARVIEKIKD